MFFRKRKLQQRGVSLEGADVIRQDFSQTSNENSYQEQQAAQQRIIAAKQEAERIQSIERERLDKQESILRETERKIQDEVRKHFKKAALQKVNFVGYEAGNLFPVPKGAVGPLPCKHGSGFMYQYGSGGHGFDKKVTGVRFCPDEGKHKMRVVYMNRRGQSVNPWTGRTVDPSHRFAHFNPRGANSLHKYYENK